MPIQLGQSLLLYILLAVIFILGASMWLTRSGVVDSLLNRGGGEQSAKGLKVRARQVTKSFNNEGNGKQNLDNASIICSRWKV
ncbi:uncharacterized protein LOC114189765 isoform X2 [Vigna unguiculata]|uniref:uncharacterized protein LOC114189765 isoform X2 n=1 Tax=Vigna unguiculata TaxID=3917 RepID=UPI001015CEC1|nr:uncharacterized protein LOC114189765 isoform X2 [Vigna unguiculata]